MNLRNLEHSIETYEAFIIGLLSRVVTWIAPLVPAVFVHDAAQTYIPGVGGGKAFLIAAVVELMGLAVVSNWLDVKEYNRRFATADKERVPEGGAVWMLVIYIVTVLVIVFGLKIAPDTFTWAAILSLSMMSVISAVAFVMRRQHGSRLRDKVRDMSRHDEDNDLDRQLARDIKLAEHRRKLAQIDADTATVSHPPATPVQSSVKLSPAQRRDMLLAELDKVSAPDDIDHDTLAGQFDVSARTIRRDIDGLVTAGRLSLNGTVKAHG